jgi:hypothetical protein
LKDFKQQGQGTMQKRFSHWLAYLWLFICTHQAFAWVAPQNALPSSSDQFSERRAKLEQHLAEAKSSADNAWMLTSAALVLMMTGPGLALFYGGLVEKRMCSPLWYKASRRWL